MGWRLIFLVVLYVASAQAVLAGSDQYFFSNQQDEQRFQRLASELRCSTCQAESVADSTHAVDMRLQIYQMITNGYSDKAILDYLAYRYGKQILERSSFVAEHKFLWVMPAVLLLAIIILSVRLYRCVTI